MLNLDKCVFGQPEIPFLGFMVSEKGIRPLPDRVKTIMEYPRPKSISDLRRFLAIINFYYRFIPKAAEMQAPLNELLKGKKKKRDQSKIEWNDITLKAFQDCKNCLANVTTLAHPAKDVVLSLMTDASDIALGAVLQQCKDSVSQPLAFFSRKLNPAETRYSAYDRELLAIYSAIRHFRYLLEGRHFTIFTDHKPLVYAFRQKTDKCSPRQLRQ